MKKRNLIKVLAVGVMVLSLAGCSSGGQTAGNTSGEQSSQNKNKDKSQDEKQDGEQSGDQGKTSENLWKPGSMVNLVVPSTAGGGHDTAARVFAKCCEQTTGVRFNIINNGSGGGAVAYAEVMNSAPDGLTVGQLGSGLASDQYMVDGCTYGPDSYQYIGIHSGDDIHLVVSTKGKFKDMDVKQFLEYAKEHAVTVACSGTWTQADTSRYAIEKAAGLTFNRVGIKGGANCALAVVSGDVDAALVFPSEVLSQVDGGNVKILAHLGEERNDFFPDVPTFKESGVDVNVPSFKILAVSADTPDEILEGWREIFRQTMEDPATAEAFLNVGVTYKELVGDDAYDYVMQTHDYMKEIIDSGVMKN